MPVTFRNRMDEEYGYTYDKVGRRTEVRSASGKSTILRRLSESLDPRKYQMLYVSDSKLMPSSYYHLLLEQMGIPRVIDKVCTSVLIYGSQNKLRLIDDHAVQMVLEGEFL